MPKQVSKGKKKKKKYKKMKKNKLKHLIKQNLI